MASIRRTMQVLDLLARRGPLGVRGVAHELALPVGSVHRLLLELSEEAVVERNSEGNFALTFRLLEIADRQIEGIAFPRLARPFAEAIARSTQENVNVNVLSGDGCVCIDKVRGSEGMQFDWRVGSRGPLHCGGSAKAILAFLGQEEQERIASQPLQRFTPNTITDGKALRAELARIRQRGYSIDDQEVVTGVFCVGVPIVDRAGRPVGAISITGPSPKKPGPAVQPLVKLLNEACSAVSRRLGYAGPWPPRQAADSAALMRGTT